MTAPTGSDTYYDAELARRPGLTWLPWIGPHYRQAGRKTLILGESTYHWKPGDAAVSERISRNDHVRVLHHNHALQFNRPSRHVRNIERALLGARTPALADKQQLWSSVVYHNLVLRPMATLKQRPRYADYHAGWQEALSLLAMLGVEQCIVYGLERVKIRALQAVASDAGIACTSRTLAVAVGRSRPVVLTLHMAERPVRLIFIRHPSAFFSWRDWAPVLTGEHFAPI